MKIGIGIRSVSYFYAIASIDGVNINSSYSNKSGYLIDGLYSRSKYENDTYTKVNCKVFIKNVKRR